MTIPVSVLVGLSPEARKARRTSPLAAPADALAERAEALIVSGNTSAAMDELEGALRVDAAHPAALFLRALVRQKHGDAAGAGEDAARLAALAPEAAEPQGLLGLIRLEAGQVDAASSAFDSAVAKAPGAGWPRALRSLACSARGEWTRALADLDRAAADYPSPWVLSRRAFVLDRVGYFDDALRVLGRVARMMPGSPEPHLLAARIHQDQAQYGRAAKRLTTALSLRPGDPELLRRRARVLLMQGRTAEAARDLDAAVDAAPKDGSVALERVRVLVILGRYGEAAAELSRLDGRAPKDGWLLAKGILLCRSGKHREAARVFGEAAAGEGDLAQRAGFYRVVAKILAETPKAPVRRAGTSPELLICGLGYRHPFQASVDVVRALARCRLVYSNLSDDRVTEFLSLFPAELKAVVFRKWRSQAETCSTQVHRGVRGGGTVGFVTRGHPLFYGRLAEKMIFRARRERVPMRVFSSVSIADMILAASGASGRGLNILDGSVVSPDLAGQLGRVPTVVYNISEKAERGRLAKRLAGLFPKGHPCWLLAGAGESEYDAVKYPVESIEEPLCSADPAVTLCLP